MNKSFALKESKMQNKKKFKWYENVCSEKQVNLEINHKEPVWTREITLKLNLNLHLSH